MQWTDRKAFDAGDGGEVRNRERAGTQAGVRDRDGGERGEQLHAGQEGCQQADGLSPPVGGGVAHSTTQAISLAHSMVTKNIASP
ncbi:MAG: hypothetical protein ACKPJD_36655 [Planctomycetaceae bacterium]